VPNVKNNRKRQLRRRGLALACLCLALSVAAACTTPPPATSQPQLTYTHQAKIRLDVDAIEIVHTYAPPMQAPNVEHLFPTSPMKTAERWATDRLVAAGASRTGVTARFVILDARVVEEKLPTTGGIGGYFTVDQGARYTATLEARLEIIDAQGKRRAFAEAKAFRDQTVPENASINKREDYWFLLTEDLLKDFEREMETAIQTHLAGFRTAP